MINYSDDILDSCDLAERLQELQDEKQDLEAVVTEAEEYLDKTEDEEYRMRAREDLEEAEYALTKWINENEKELVGLQRMLYVEN